MKIDDITARLANPVGSGPAVRLCREARQEILRLQPGAEAWKMLADGIEAMCDADIHGAVPHSECLDRYIDAWRRQRDRITELEAVALEQHAAGCEEYERAERTAAALAPFAKVASGIPDNWPGKCPILFARDGNRWYLVYVGLDDECPYPTIAQWQAAAEASGSDGK